MITYEVARWMAERAIEDIGELDDRDLEEWSIDRFQADRAHDLATGATAMLASEKNPAATLQSIARLHASTECQVCGRTYGQHPDPLCDCGTEGEEFVCTDCDQEYPCRTIRAIESGHHRDSA